MRFTLYKVYPRWHRVEILRFSLTIFYQKKTNWLFFTWWNNTQLYSFSYYNNFYKIYISKTYCRQKKIAIFYQRVNTIKKKPFAIHQHLNIKYNFIHFFSKRKNNFQEKFVKVWSPTLNIKKIKPTIFPFYLKYRNYKSFHHPL